MVVTEWKSRKARGMLLYMKNNETLRVNEIFSSIEGEGARTGYPVTFIRLQGCNLECSYCDTRYSCVGNEGQNMTVDDILVEVTKLHNKRITLTGGEPLIHKNVVGLIIRLLHLGYEVNIETNGSVDVLPYTMYSNIILTVDYKCYGSGMNKLMNHDNLECLRKQDVLKFVVSDLKDLAQMKMILHCYDIKAEVFVSPVFGKIEPVEIVDYIKKHDLQKCRVQLQLHKYIWNPQERGV